MTKRDGFPAGVFSWIDIGTDVGGAKAFYGPLFGWTAQEAGPPEETGGYGFFLLDGAMVAGYGPQQNPGPPFWACYVAVDDADVAAKSVEEAGGSVIMPPMEVMSAGRMAVFQDDSGAFFSVWQPGEHTGAQRTDEPGALAWVELTTRDVAAAKAFYPKVFGWTFETHEGAMEYTEFANDGKSFCGMMATPPMVPAEVPSYWMPYIGAADVDATASKAEGLGATLLVPPTDIPGGDMRFAVLTDPQGATFGLVKSGS